MQAFGLVADRPIRIIKQQQALLQELLTRRVYYFNSANTSKKDEHIIDKMKHVVRQRVTLTLIKSYSLLHTG